LVVIAATVGAIVAASPSLASASPRTAPNHRLHYGVSTNWSGYAVAGAGPYTARGRMQNHRERLLGVLGGPGR